MKVEQEPAYLLHSIPYRETSVIAELFTLRHGKLSGVLRGQRPLKSRRAQTIVQPFSPLLVSWVGKTELKTITSCERGTAGIILKGESLYSGLYCNELLVKLLAPNDPYPELFHHYVSLLDKLGAGEDIEICLRNFELDFLNELGYGIDFECETRTQEPIVEEQWYELFDEEGFVRLGDKPDQGGSYYPGTALLPISQRNFNDPQTRLFAKRLMRRMIDFRLGGKPIAARELFRKPG